jgi:hypothetical protein
MHHTSVVPKKKRAERQAPETCRSRRCQPEGRSWLRSHGGGDLSQQMPDDCVARGAAK